MDTTIRYSLSDRIARASAHLVGVVAVSIGLGLLMSYLAPPRLALVFGIVCVVAASMWVIVRTMRSHADLSGLPAQVKIVGMLGARTIDVESIENVRVLDRFRSFPSVSIRTSKGTVRASVCQPDRLVELIDLSRSERGPAGS